MGWCWITSRSGWLLELLTELTNHWNHVPGNLLKSPLVHVLKKYEYIGRLCRSQKLNRRINLQKKVFMNIRTAKMLYIAFQNPSLLVKDNQRWLGPSTCPKSTWLSIPSRHNSLCSLPLNVHSIFVASVCRYLCKVLLDNANCTE